MSYRRPVQVVAVQRARRGGVVETGEGAPPCLETGKVIEERPPRGAADTLLVRSRGHRQANERSHAIDSRFRTGGALPDRSAIAVSQSPPTRYEAPPTSSIAARGISSARFRQYEMAPEKDEAAMWLATLASDRPLTFLDHHLRAGNSLLGASLLDIVRRPFATSRARSAALPLFDDEVLDEAMEATVAQKAASSVDIVCVDGSLVSRLLKSTADAASEVVKRLGRSIFVSKSSESKLQFGDMGSRAGDIYYYGHAGKGVGFSIPVETQFRHAPLYEVYARLRAHTPMVRIEVLGATSKQEITKILDRLRYHSVAGYPYCLKRAHNNCKISNEDIDGLASIFSLQHEQGARDALNE